MVDRRYNSRLTVEAVRISAKKKTKKKNKVGIRRQDELQVPPKNGKEIQDVAHMTASKTAEKIFKKQSSELYQKIYKSRRPAKYRY